MSRGVFNSVKQRLSHLFSRIKSIDQWAVVPDLFLNLTSSAKFGKTAIPQFYAPRSPCVFLPYRHASIHCMFTLGRIVAPYLGANAFSFFFVGAACVGGPPCPGVSCAIVNFSISVKEWVAHLCAHLEYQGVFVAAIAYNFD